MKILKLITQRLTSPTPKFWKKAAWLGGVLTAVSVGLLSAPDTIHIPDMLQTAASYLATAGFVLTVVAKATTTDPELTEK